MALKSTSTFLDHSEFSKLTDPLATRPFRLSIRNYCEWLTREQAWLLFRGELRLEEPLRLGAYQGGSPSDFLWAGLTHIVCISTRVAKLLTENEVTGWDTYPVTIFDREGKLVPGYSGFSVVGPACRWDRSRSQIVDKPPPVPGGMGYQVYRGLYFDEAQWDGSDFFLVQRLNRTVVTAMVATLFKRKKVYNARLTPLPDVETDRIPWMER